VPVTRTEDAFSRSAISENNSYALSSIIHG